MSDFQEEYYQRLRRVGGIYDDSVAVKVESGQEDGSWSGGCETCNFYMEGAPYVKIFAVYPYYKELASFEDMGELIRALDNVELDSVG